MLVLGGNVEDHLLGDRIGYVFRHSTSFYGAGAPVLWIVKVRPRHGEKGWPLTDLGHSFRAMRVTKIEL